MGDTAKSPGRELTEKLFVQIAPVMVLQHRPEAIVAKAIELAQAFLDDCAKRAL